MTPFLNANTLLEWFNVNKRDLPWRNTHDPYQIWISEIILQQTRVDQGKDYFFRFIERFPDINALASANIDEILKLWQGLGYYSRAHNLHKTAKFIAQNHQGIFPEKYEQILSLSGIGEYTAAAIASFAFNLPYPVCDGNVMRVITRFFGIEEPIDKSKTKTEILNHLVQIMPARNSANFNQAMMEFGAIHCKPMQPLCNNCPFSDDCFAYRNNKISSIPFKANKTKVVDVQMNFLFLVDKSQRFIIKKRDNKSIWKGLYTFPTFESKIGADLDSLMECAGKSFNETPNYICSSDLIIHKLSHRKISAYFHVFKGDQLLLRDDEILISDRMLENYAFPQLVVNQLEWLFERC